MDPFTAPRHLGLLPLLFFAGMAWRHRRSGRFGEAFWMCHLSNLLLSAGMLFKAPMLVQASVPWLLIGIPLWIFDMLHMRSLILASVVSHLGGTALGLYALKWAGPVDWTASFVFYLAAQLFCRFATPPKLNVNLAHRVYDGYERFFPNYPAFWAFITSVTAALLWGVRKFLTALNF